MDGQNKIKDRILKKLSRNVAAFYFLSVFKTNAQNFKRIPRRHFWHRYSYFSFHRSHTIYLNQRILWQSSYLNGGSCRFFSGNITISLSVLEKFPSIQKLSTKVCFQIWSF